MILRMVRGIKLARRTTDCENEIDLLKKYLKHLKYNKILTYLQSEWLSSSECALLALAAVGEGRAARAAWRGVCMCPCTRRQRGHARH